MTKGDSWSVEEIAKLRSLYPSDLSFEEILEKFPERSANAIRLKASRLGLKRRIYYPKINHINSLVHTEGNNLKGYLVRCNDCFNLIHVEEFEVSNSNLIRCDSCGSISYLVF